MKREQGTDPADAADEQIFPEIRDDGESDAPRNDDASVEPDANGSDVPPG